MEADASAWVRHRPGRRENLVSAGAAAAAGLAVGALTFYLTRLLVAREPVSRHPPGDALRGRVRPEAP